MLDYCQLSLWYVTLYCCVHYLGLWYGLAAYWAGVQFVLLVLKKAFGLEMMNASDELFFLDDYRQNGNIVAFHRTQKMDADVYRRAQIKRSF